MSVPFAKLGKLADVVEVVSHLQMVVVDISADTLRGRPVTQSHKDFIAVSDTELFVIAGCDEANTTLRPFQVSVQPVLHIAIAVKVIVAPVRA